MADPTIFQQGKKFYLYGTVEGASGTGFQAYTSTNLKHWKHTENNDGYVLRKEDAFGTSGFWAPQVFLYNGVFYMAYVANENIAIAESITPAGPFTQRTKAPLAAPVKQIDPFLFIDDDGRKYLYHVRLIDGNKIFVAEMTDDLSAIQPETVRECITVTADWEHTAKTTWKWPVVEGPSVFKHKNTYYLVYTANDFRNPDYAVGYATSNSPFGPWKKYSGNPIINKTHLGQNGPGHGDFFKKGNDLYYVFHTHNAVDKVGPRKTAVVKMRFVKAKHDIDKLEADVSSFHFLFKHGE
ncbi:MAG: glycoside hydrolase family 43 protein [Bacteroidota bacterium]|nr:glycoside hydrolase family 43 protein [Bacteroidota bacterium]